MSWFLALFSRVALLVVWLTTPLVNRAFHGGWILPLLGILLLPITTLTYVLVYYGYGSVAGWGWLLVALAVLLALAGNSYPARSTTRARSRSAGGSSQPGSISSRHRKARRASVTACEPESV